MAQCSSGTEQTLLGDMINTIFVPQTLIDNISMLTGDLFRSFVEHECLLFLSLDWRIACMLLFLHHQWIFIIIHKVLRTV